VGVAGTPETKKLARFSDVFYTVLCGIFLTKLTRGKHLWLRNNASTIGSQLIDTMLILSILYVSGGLGAEVDSIGRLLTLMASSYSFKVAFALFDTPFFYLGVYILRHRVGLVDLEGISGV
jgi:uncharacterized integral membrane protein (TIGR00697 family)